MSQSFIKKPDNGPHSALTGLGVLANERPNRAIDVYCIATPDGHAYWAKADSTDVLERFWNNWRARLPLERAEELEAAGACGGVVKIRMLESDYLAIGATSESAELFGPSTPHHPV